MSLQPGALVSDVTNKRLNGVMFRIPSSRRIKQLTGWVCLHPIDTYTLGTTGRVIFLIVGKLDQRDLLRF